MSSITNATSCSASRKLVALCTSAALVFGQAVLAAENEAAASQDGGAAGETTAAQNSSGETAGNGLGFGLLVLAIGGFLASAFSDSGGNNGTTATTPPPPP